MEDTPPAGTRRTDWAGSASTSLRLIKLTWVMPAGVCQGDCNSLTWFGEATAVDWVRGLKNGCVPANAAGARASRPAAMPSRRAVFLMKRTPSMPERKMAARPRRWGRAGDAPTILTAVCGTALTGR